MLDAGFEAGRAEGVDIGIAISADFIEARGDSETAKALREAKIEQAEAAKGEGK